MNKSHHPNAFAFNVNLKDSPTSSYQCNRRQKVHAVRIILEISKPEQISLLLASHHIHFDTIYFVKYDGCIRVCSHKDPVAVVKEIATFLEKTLDQTQLQKIVDHCTFKAMRMNPSTNYSWIDDLGYAVKNNETEFFRKGVYFHSAFVRQNLMFPFPVFLIFFNCL